MQEYCYHTYDNGVGIGWQDFLNLTYRQRRELQDWFDNQKKREEEQRK